MGQLLGEVWLAQGRDGEKMLSFFRELAPSWRAQIAPFSTKQLTEMPAVTPERMLREMARALEVLSAERPLVLVLEDLHWSDYATLDLLAVLARRQESARLLVLAAMIVAIHVLWLFAGTVFARFLRNPLASRIINLVFAVTLVLTTALAALR